MGKYDHICVLSGTENYLHWRAQMTLALQKRHIWPHCSSGTDPTDPASYMPTPKDGKAITADEKEQIRDWLAKDAQTKALIDRKISPIVSALLCESHTARQQWEALARYYFCVDPLSQYALRTRLRTEKLKDAEDATRYIHVFEDARCRLLQMGVTYTTEESVFDLLQGLPEGIRWELLDKLSTFTVTFGSTALTTTSSTSSCPFTFQDATKLLLEKVNAMAGRRRSVGPRSAAVSRVNPTTGIRTSKNNPQGVRCLNPICVGKSRSATHDKDHCYWPGGGMEDSAPA